MMRSTSSFSAGSITSTSPQSPRRCPKPVEPDAGLRAPPWRARAACCRAPAPSLFVRDPVDDPHIEPEPSSTIMTDGGSAALPRACPHRRHQHGQQHRQGPVLACRSPWPPAPLVVSCHASWGHCTRPQSWFSECFGIFDLRASPRAPPMGQETVDLLLKRRSAKPALLSAARPDTGAARAPSLPPPSGFPTTRSWSPGASSSSRARPAPASAASCSRPASPRRRRLLRPPAWRWSAPASCAPPLVIGVISRVTPNAAAPEWEQILSCGAACFNLCLAANAMGFGTSWITEWYSYSRAVREGPQARRQRAHRRLHLHRHRHRAAARPRPPSARQDRHPLDGVSHWP